MAVAVSVAVAVAVAVSVSVSVAVAVAVSVAVSVSVSVAVAVVMAVSVSQSLAPPLLLSPCAHHPRVTDRRSHFDFPFSVAQSLNTTSIILFRALTTAKNPTSYSVPIYEIASRTSEGGRYSRRMRVGSQTRFGRYGHALSGTSTRHIWV